MNKTTTGILTVIGIAAIVAAVYHFTNKGKKQYAKTIVKYGGGSNYVWLLTADEGYLKAWAKALVNSKSSFDYNGKTYNAIGGKTIIK
jgi:hypothetical protein